MKVLFLIIFSGFSLLTMAQQDTIITGSLTIIQDTAITTLLNTKPVIQSKQTTQGYRIQLTSSANRKEVYDLKTEFLKYYPDVRAYVTYQQPYFKLRIGDFTDRTAANEFRDLINSRFPGFIVPESVNLNTDKE
jgi:hypothetical protein